jgi:hypothetical protein
MRYEGLLLGSFQLVLMCALGCVHPQPDLKPPQQAEVLDQSGPKDKRYSDPATYPPDQLASDPIKAQLKDSGIVPLQAPKKTPGFGGAPPGF